MKLKMITLLSLSLIVAGCNTTGSGNDITSAFNDFMNFATTKDSNGYSASSPKYETAKKTITVNTDVDTAAARLKRHYEFRSEEEVAQLNNGSQIGVYREAAARNGKYMWMAQPGSYYKMGRNLSQNVAMNLEIVKDGTNRSKIYATFWYKPDTLDVEKSVPQIKAVAEGRR